MTGAGAGIDVFVWSTAGTGTMGGGFSAILFSKRILLL